jgi:hypothetical protein
LVAGRRAVFLSVICSSSKYRAVSVTTLETKEDGNKYLVVFCFQNCLFDIQAFSGLRVRQSPGRFLSITAKYYGLTSITVVCYHMKSAAVEHRVTLWLPFICLERG